MVKTSSKDETLIKHLTAKLAEWEPETTQLIQYGEMLKGCDAYIATGSNNSAGYFEYYFKKYPHIIRRNRTSVAILTGDETMEELERLLHLKSMIISQIITNTKTTTTIISPCTCSTSVII